MKIPKYVQELMSRAEFVLGAMEPGYTIKIYKRTPYTKIPTLKAEVKRLKKWVERVMPEDETGIPTMVINNVPSETHYRKQSAVVTIFDPVMKNLEPYIPKKK